MTGFARSEVPSYRAIHMRVTRLYGPAKKHPCQLCGAPARQWAYDGQDPTPLTERDRHRPTMTRIYSADPDHYLPLCIRCHRAYDGHSIDPDEVARRCAARHAALGDCIELVGEDGSRRCKTWEVLRTRRHRARLTPEQWASYLQQRREAYRRAQR